LLRIGGLVVATSTADTDEFPISLFNHFFFRAQNVTHIVQASVVTSPLLVGFMGSSHLPS